jgi:hypothetical protein
MTRRESQAGMTIIESLRRLDRALGTGPAFAWLRRGEHGTRRILVDSRTAVNYEMVAPVLRTMAADDRVTFAFTASEEPEQIQSIYRTAPPGTRLVSAGRAALTRWDAYLTSDFMWATLPRGTCRIQMFHGVAGKYGFDDPRESMRQWDRLFFVNERRLRNFVRSGAIDADSPAGMLIGMPKVDCLVDGTFQRDAVLREIDLDPALPTVLYAPTWSAASSLNRLGVPLLERLSAMPLNLIVKLHDRSRDLREQYSGGIDWPARLAGVLRRPRAVLADGANIAPYLVAADVMISDHSSAAFEYLLLDRPLVRIDIPELMTVANVHPEYAALLAEASDTVIDVGETVAAVERAMAAPGRRSQERRRVAADLFYQPGTASARCAAALYDAVGLQTHPSVAGALSEERTCLQSA